MFVKDHVLFFNPFLTCALYSKFICYFSSLLFFHVFFNAKLVFPTFIFSSTPFLFARDHSLSSSIPSHAITCATQNISPPLPFTTFSLSTVSTQGKTQLAYVAPLFSCVHVDFRSPDFARTCTVFLTSNVNFSRSRQTNRIILAPIP